MAFYRVYVRYSDKQRQQHGSSEERQWDIGKHRKRAAELGAELIEIPYIDRGKSGFHGDNLEAELGRIKGHIQSGLIPRGDILWVESHSRLGRLTPGEAVMQYLGFLRDGIRLDIKGVLRSWQSINGEHGLPTLMNDFIEIFTAHQESLNKQKFARDTNRLKRDKLRAGTKTGVMKTGTAGWFVGKRCPAWLEPLPAPDPDGYLYRNVEAVARVVRMIFDWRESGIGCYVIAQRLTDTRAEPLRNAHIVNPEKIHRGGWSQSMVARVLRNEAVIGRYHPNVIEYAKDENGDPVRGKRITVEDGDGPVEQYYPSVLVDPGQFWRVRALVEKSDKSGNQRGKGRTGKQFGNIVHGIGQCECCDGPVRKWKRTQRPGTPGKSMSYLKCENSRRKVALPEGHPLAGQRCPNRKGFQYPTFETALFGLFNPAMLPVLSQMIPQKHPDDLVTRRLSDCEAKIAKAEQSTKRLVRLASKADDDETADAYDAEINLIRADLKKLRVDRDRLQQQVFSHGQKQEEMIAEVINKLTDASDPKALYDTRAKLNQLLVNAISLTLHDDCKITVQINAHSGLNPVVARFTLDGLQSIDVIARDGSVLTHFSRAGLGMLEPIGTQAA